MLYKYLRSNKGFTLTEIMIVVVILGILTAVALPLFHGVLYIQKRNDCKSNREIIEGTIKQAMLGKMDDGVPQRNLADELYINMERANNKVKLDYNEENKTYKESENGDIECFKIVPLKEGTGSDYVTIDGTCYKIIYYYDEDESDKKYKKWIPPVYEKDDDGNLVLDENGNKKVIESGRETDAFVMCPCSKDGEDNVFTLGDVRCGYYTYEQAVDDIKYINSVDDLSNLSDDYSFGYGKYIKKLDIETKNRTFEQIKYSLRFNKYEIGYTKTKKGQTLNEKGEVVANAESIGYYLKREKFKDIPMYYYFDNSECPKCPFSDDYTYYILSDGTCICSECQ